MIATATESIDRRRQARFIEARLNRSGWIKGIIDGCKEGARSMQKWSTTRLADHTQRLRRYRADRCGDGGPTHADDQLLVLAGAAVMESLRRVHAIELFDVQLHCGLAVCCGAVAEMQTGEGKTLSILFPAYYQSLSGRGVHVATPNEYLAERDYLNVQPVLSALGVTSGLLKQDADKELTQRAYRADVTYGPGYLFGFDYLRDRLSERNARQLDAVEQFSRLLSGRSDSDQRLQRPLFAAIVDEADHVLIDDAISPLVLTSKNDQPAEDAEIYREASTVAASLKPTIHFIAETRSPRLTDHGLSIVYANDSLAMHPRLMRPWHEYVELALSAAWTKRRDVDYIVSDGTVQLVDTATGRIFKDRNWSNGLHQAVQAHEGLEITSTQVPLARVTRQSFYRQYRSLAGLTGTARGCAKELSRVYGLPVVEIPLRKGSRRIRMTDHLSLKRNEKQTAIIDECKAMVQAGRAVLIGTHSIVESMEICQRLQASGFKPALLNGVQDMDEALIIARAGKVGTITVATHLAGRGTDITLDAKVKANGGLHIILSQPHSLCRVDRQLIGRAARCGDPGSYRRYVCAEDTLVKHQAPWLEKAISRSIRSSVNETSPIETRVLAIQAKNERSAAAQRWQLMLSDQAEQQLMKRDRKRNPSTSAMVTAGDDDRPQQM